MRDANPIPKEATEGSSGLDQMRAICDGRLGVAPMQALMNMRLIEVEDGRVVFGGTPEEKHHNPGGTVHAAFKAAVLGIQHGPRRAHHAAARRWTNDDRIQTEYGPAHVSGHLRSELKAPSSIAAGRSRRLKADPAGKLIAHGNHDFLARRHPHSPEPWLGEGDIMITRPPLRQILLVPRSALRLLALLAGSGWHKKVAPPSTVGGLSPFV